MTSFSATGFIVGAIAVVSSVSTKDSDAVPTLSTASITEAVKVLMPSVSPSETFVTAKST